MEPSNGDNGSNQGQPGGAGGIGSDTGTGGTGGVGGKGGKGERGETGVQGIQGRQGESLPTLKITDNRLLFIFVATIAILGLLGWRNEVTYTRTQKVQHTAAVNSQLIRDNAYKQAVFVYALCQSRLKAVNKLNTQNRAFVVFYVAVIPQTSQTRQLMKLYRDSILDVPVCGKKPVR